MSKYYENIECPYCGSNAIVSGGDLNKYQCDECKYLFDDEDVVREKLRRKISVILSANYADEHHPMPCEMPLGEDADENCGLSSLDLPWIESVFQENDGTMWAYVTGYESEINFDGISTSDLGRILDVLTEG